MSYLRIVIDTCVVISALKSRKGLSQRLLRQINDDVFETALSVPLMLEYEEVSNRLVDDTDFTQEELSTFLDFLCTKAGHYRVSFLWRKFLCDADDDMVLELAVAANCQHIVTYNIGDFAGCEKFGITALTPSEFLLQLEGTK